MANVSAAATSSRAVLEVLRFTSRVLPASSDLTWEADKLAISSDLDPSSTDNGPSFEAFLWRRGSYGV